MKRIVYLTFYFTPDLCAGSFRNTPLALELAERVNSQNIFIDVYTTLPNRYSSYDIEAPSYEEFNNLRIHRISLPPHKSGMIDQIFSFLKFYSKVIKLNKGKKVDLVFASSSRLFTAFLGYKIALKSRCALYLDIRDIFVDTINDVIKSHLLKRILLPILHIIETKTFSYASHINLISEGFKEYFARFNHVELSFYTNGIDEEFVSNTAIVAIDSKKSEKKLIVYAGNIGEGQGLEKIIPPTAKLLGDNFEFLIIGDGGAKRKLQTEIDKYGVKNVILKNPVKRAELQQIYNSSDYLFLHLNDYPAFRKVLPSKIFELATFNKKILAGVSGYSAEFIRNEISYSFVFEPCCIDQLVDFLINDKREDLIERNDFISKYKRSNINQRIVSSILGYL